MDVFFFFFLFFLFDKGISMLLTLERRMHNPYTHVIDKLKKIKYNTLETKSKPYANDPTLGVLMEWADPQLTWSFIVRIGIGPALGLR